MGCLISKYRKKSNSFSEGLTYTHFSKAKYRPHHYLINRYQDRFSNEMIAIYGETDSGQSINLEIGINRDRWKFSDHDYNDEMKDGNNTY